MADINEFEGQSPENIFDVPYKEALIHQSVTTYEANQRPGIVSAKSRSEVSGRNKKPWRQKGTGRSRHGSRISPLWVGGGQAQAPNGEQNHGKDLTKKMKRQALFSSLSQRSREGNIRIMEAPELDQPNTSTMDDFFAEHDLSDRKILLLINDDQKIIRLSSRNLPYCDPFDVNSLNTYEVVSHPYLVFSESAMKQLKEIYSDGT